MTPYHHKFTPWRARNGQRVVAAESHWKLPLRWNRAAEKAGERRIVEVTYDVFEDWNHPMVDAQGRTLLRCGQCGEEWAGDYQTDMMKPATRCKRFNEGCMGHGIELLATMNDIRRRLFSLIDQTPNLDWLLLTERPENVGRMMPLSGIGDFHDRDEVSTLSQYRPNVWLGVQASTQAETDERIPHLLRVPSAVRLLSMKPLLEPVDLDEWVFDREFFVKKAMLGPMALNRDQAESQIMSMGIHWVIVSGETGHNARPMHPDWVRSIRDQCVAAGVPFYFLGWGEWCGGTDFYSGTDDGGPKGMYAELENGKTLHESQVAESDWKNWVDDPDEAGLNDPVSVRVGKEAAGATLDGREWREMPT